MSMIKLISPMEADFGEPVCAMIKMSSRGLLGRDRTDFIKRASAELAYEIGRIKVAVDEALIHSLIVGADEFFGGNRNGDAFKEAACRDYAHTFTKYGHFFRNHLNKDPAKSYGRVKYAWYNPRMHRVELITALNTTEEAARRNGGLIADKEMEKLAAGKPIPLSMACKVPYDECSYCQHKAPKVEDYCFAIEDGGLCKAGGLRDNMGAVVEIDGGLHQLRAFNDHPAWFDQSYVFRGADRIAFVTGQLEKRANSRGVVPSAKIAEVLGVTLPYELLIEKAMPSNVSRMLKLAYHLADLETDVEAGSQSVPDHTAGAFNSDVQRHTGDLPPLFREKFSHALRAMADSRICLPLDKFIEVVADQPMDKAASAAQVVRRELPGIYGRLLTDANLPERLAENPYIPAGHAASPAMQLWAEKQAAAYSLSESHVQRRVTVATLRGEESGLVRRGQALEKAAADRGACGQMAEHYALYKLAFLAAIPETTPDLPLTSTLTILQNYT